MKSEFKFLVHSFIFLLLFFMCYLLIRLFLTTELNNIEIEQAITIKKKANILINNELKKVRTIANDWGLWDELYNYTSTKNDSFIETNITNVIFQTLGLDIICIFDENGKILIAKKFDFSKNEIRDICIGSDLENIFSPFFKFPAGYNVVDGIVTFNKNVLFAALSNILRGDGQGPQKGTILMGAFLNRQMQKKISEVLPVECLFMAPWHPDYRDITRKIKSSELVQETLIEPEGKKSDFTGNTLWQMGMNSL